MTTSAEPARQAFAGRLQASLWQQGHVLGGAAGSQALWQQYRAVADHAVAGWTTGYLVDPALGRPLFVERDEAVGLAGDLVLAVEGAETDLFEDRVSIGVSRPAVAVSTNDAVLVHSVDPRGRIAQTVVPYAAVLSAEPVVVAVGPARPGLQLVYLDEAGEDQVVVVGVAGFSATDGAARETIRDAFLGRVVERAHQQGAPLGDDEYEHADTGPGWVPGPVGAPGWAGQQYPHAPGRNAGLVAALVAAVVLVLVLAGTLAFVLLRDPGLAQGQCLAFDVLQTQDGAVDCASPRAFYRVELLVPGRPAGNVGDLSPCPAATSAFAWWADDEDRLFSADAPPFNALADGRLVCIGLVG